MLTDPNGLYSNLYVRPTTTLTVPLQNAVNSGQINLFTIPVSMNRNKKQSPGLITAAELMRKLNRDSEFVHHREERDKHLTALDNEFAQNERPLVEALNDAAIPVNSVWNLVNTSKAYPKAIPILIAHLTRSYPDRIREGIARALTSKHAGEAAYTELVAEFKKVSDSTDVASHSFKWALGNSISIVADKKHFDDVVELIRDKRHGTTRDMMTLRLPSIDRERAVEVLIEALADNEISGHAVMAFAKLKVQKARLYIECVLAHHPQQWVRKEAKKALTKLEK